jgi:ABC-type nitrate/sulfonate/bicarbonate transport system permease component
VRALLRLYPFALAVGLWWLLSAGEVLGNEFVMPPPSRVFERARELLGDGTLGHEASVTLGRVLLAFGLACAVGVLLGTLIGCVRPVRQALRPVVAFFFPAPKVALYPAMLIVLGLGASSKVALGFSEALFPVLLATAAGTSRVEPQLVWSAASLGTPRRAALLKVVVPAALPAILTGARIGLVGAIVGVFLAEMIAAADGLGHLMAVSYRTLDTPTMYVAILCVSVGGYVLDRAFLLARGRLLVWSEEQG